MSSNIASLSRKAPQSLLAGHDLKNSQITSVAENSWLALPISISGR